MRKSTGRGLRRRPSVEMLSDLDSLKNLSGAGAQILRDAGIGTPSELHSLGAVGAYVRVKRAGLEANLDLLYAIEGAIRNMNWADLPYAVRASLTLEADAYLTSEGLR